MKREIVPTDRIVGSIRWIRGQKVLLDSDLAALYGVTTANLNKAVSRNRDRFPPDFMFQLGVEESKRLIFQTGMSKGRGGRAGERTRLACKRQSGSDRWRPRHRELLVTVRSLGLEDSVRASRRGRRKEHARRVCSPR